MRNYKPDKYRGNVGMKLYKYMTYRDRGRFFKQPLLKFSKG